VSRGAFVVRSRSWLEPTHDFAFFVQLVDLPFGKAKYESFLSASLFHPSVRFHGSSRERMIIDGSRIDSVPMRFVRGRICPVSPMSNKPVISGIVAAGTV
jgi:hypothetical protein